MKAVVCLMVAQFLIAFTPCGAQDRALKLDLVSARVRPGAPVFVNAMLTNPAGAPVQAISQNIQFPPELVFTQARLGIAGNLAAASLSLEMKDKAGVKVEKKEAARSLHLTISAKQPLHEGPLVELEFRLADSKEQTIRLTHSAEAQDGQGKKIELVFSDTEVVVSEEIGSEPRPAIGCFFFTH